MNTADKDVREKASAFLNMSMWGNVFSIGCQNLGFFILSSPAKNIAMIFPEGACWPSTILNSGRPTFVYQI